MDIAPMPTPIEELRPARALIGDRARARLDDLGLTGIDLLEICREGFRSAADQFSPFEPVTAFGFQRWAKTVGRLRDALDAVGWSHPDINNAPRSLSPDGTVLIAAIAGDERTSDPKAVPSNARARGTTFTREVTENASTATVIPARVPLLFDQSTFGAESSRSTRTTWVLLYFWDRAANEIRAELSLPEAIRDGRVTSWRERILLGSAPLAEVLPLDALDGLPTDEVEFDVEAV